jgi:hypothetical protein
MKKVIVLVLTLIASTFSFAATLHSLNKAGVKQAFVGKTIVSVPATHLNAQVLQNSFIAYIDPNGTMMGKFMQKPADAPQMDKGTYVIKDNGEMCLTWQQWDNGKQFCVNVFDTKNAYIIVDNEHMFHTVFMKDVIKEGNHYAD